MLALALLVLAQGSGQGDIPDEGPGFLLIAAIVVAAIVVIGGIWTLAARRGSRVPRSRPDREGRTGRSR